MFRGRVPLNFEGVRRRNSAWGLRRYAGTAGSAGSWARPAVLGASLARPGASGRVRSGRMRRPQTGPESFVGAPELIDRPRLLPRVLITRRVRLLLAPLQ